MQLNFNNINKAKTQNKPNNSFVEEPVTIEEVFKIFADNKDEIETQGLEIYRDGIFVIKNIKLSYYGKEKENIRFEGTLTDKTGSLTITSFGVQEHQKEYYLGMNGTVVKTNFRINSYKEKPQAMAVWIKPMAEGTYDKSMFLTRSTREPQEMYDEVIDCAEYIKNDLNAGLGELIERIYSENKEKLLFYPAAKSVHEAYVGGLLTHVTNMLHYAQGIAEVNPIVRKDLLYTGVVLHDIEKLTEFELDDFGNVTRYSDKGNLFGHLYMGAHLIQNKIDEINAEHGEKIINDEDAMRLVHMILSHHGKYEYEAVRKPATVEAMILYQVDTLDSQLEQMYDFYNDPMTKPGQTADMKSFTLDVKPYRPIDL